MIRIAERRSRLLGLDRPVKIAETNPDGTALPVMDPLTDLLSKEELEAIEAIYSRAEERAGRMETPATEDVDEETGSASEDE